MNGNESSKTAWFLAAAALIVGAAWLTRPVPAIKGEAAVLGKKLFPDFNDPATVDNLRIVEYDQAKGDALGLEVAKINGLWVIPSHSKYPADAKDHLAAAANSLIDLTILGLAPGFNPGSPPMDESCAPQGIQSLRRHRSRSEGTSSRATTASASG